MSQEHRKSPVELFYGEKTNYTDYLRTFGEVRIVLDEETKKTRAKLQDRVLECLFVGYPDDHAGDVYKLLSLATKKIIKSRNVIWMNKAYSEYKNIFKINTKTVVEENLDEDDTIIVSNATNNEALPIVKDGEANPRL